MTAPPPPSSDDARGPGPEHGPPKVTPRDVLVRMMITLTVATGLSSHHLLATAERLPLGPGRDVLVATALNVDDVAGDLGLHGPDRLLRELTGRPPRANGGSPVVAGPARAAGPEARSEGLTPAPSDSRESVTTSTSTSTSTTGPTVGTTARPTTTSTQPTNSTEAPGSGTAPTAPPLRSVRPEQKLRIWAGGDSLGEYVGNQLLSPVTDPALTEVQLDYRISTGLARPDYFDWFSRIEAVMNEEQPPEALVFMVGGNDNQNMESGGDVLEFGSDRWYDEYRRRVGLIMDSGRSGTSHFFWIGLPPMRDAGRQGAAVEINRILAEEADARPWVTYIDIEHRFAGPDGAFSTHIADDEGHLRVARAPDGVHITFDGSSWVADQVWTEITERWTLLGSPPETPSGGGPVGSGA